MSTEPKLEEANLLELAPVRTASWREREGGLVTIERPKATTRGLRGLLERLGNAMAVPLIKLDELGSATWRLLDGRRTVAEVCQAMRDEFGEDSEPQEERQRLFLGMLRKGGFIGLPGFDDEAIARWHELAARQGIRTDVPTSSPDAG